MAVDKRSFDDNKFWIRHVTDNKINHEYVGQQRTYFLNLDHDCDSHYFFKVATYLNFENETKRNESVKLISAFIKKNIKKLIEKRLEDKKKKLIEKMPSNISLL